MFEKKLPSSFTWQVINTFVYLPAKQCYELFSWWLTGANVRKRAANITVKQTPKHANTKTNATEKCCKQKGYDYWKISWNLYQPKNAKCKNKMLQSQNGKYWNERYQTSSSFLQLSKMQDLIFAWKVWSDMFFFLLDPL